MASRTSGPVAPNMTRVKVALMLLAAVVSLLGVRDLATGASAFASVPTTSAP